MIAVPDGRGGVLFQESRGRPFGGSDPSTIVWWLEAGSSTPRELLVPSPGHFLSLHQVVEVDGRLKVLYTRHEGTGPNDMGDRLRLIDVETLDITELGWVGGWESLSYNITMGGGLVGREWLGEGWHGFAFTDSSGKETFIPADPFQGEAKMDCEAPCRRLPALSRDGLHLAYIEYAYEGDIVADFLLIIRHVETGDELTTIPLGWRQTWSPVSLDLVGSNVVVNRRSGTLQDVTEPALLVDLATGQTVEAPLAGEARIDPTP